MKKTKMIAICLLTVVLTAFAVGALANITDGWRNWDSETWFEEDRNPENLLKLTTYTSDLEYVDNGTNIVINPDGSLTFKQIKESANDEDTYFTFATVTLNAGTYTYTGSPKGTSSTYKLIADYVFDEGGATIRVNADNAGSCTFTLTERTEVTFKLFIADKFVSEKGVTVHPTLASGSEKIDFYLD